MTHKRKVFAYITDGDRLLVFRHVDFPKAGIQVPGGTVQPGEDFETALQREVQEETGLTDLELVGPVGEQERDMSDFGMDEVHEQRYYHLRCLEAPAETWRHVEEYASDGSGPLVFEFSWVYLTEGTPGLVGGQGQFLPRLIRNIQAGQSNK